MKELTSRSVIHVLCTVHTVLHRMVFSLPAPKLSSTLKQFFLNSFWRKFESKLLQIPSILLFCCASQNEFDTPSKQQKMLLHFSLSLFYFLQEPFSCFTTS